MGVFNLSAGVSGGPATRALRRTPTRSPSVCRGPSRDWAPLSPVSRGPSACRGPSLQGPLCVQGAPLQGSLCLQRPPLCTAPPSVQPPLCAGAPLASVYGPLSLCAGTPSVQEPLYVPIVASSGFFKIPQDSPRFPFRTSTRSCPEGLGPWAPLVFCFCFLLPACPLQIARPHTHREIKNTPPWAGPTAVWPVVRSGT